MAELEAGQDSKQELDKQHGTPKRLRLEIELAEKWRENALKDAQDARDAYDAGSKRSANEYEADTGFNIFSSQIDTLKPLIYSQTPKVIVERAFKDRDEVGRAAAQILERATSHAISDPEGGFDPKVRHCRNDWLIPGVGQIWMRYEYDEIEIAPKIYIQQQEQPAPPPEIDPQTGQPLPQEPMPPIWVQVADGTPLEPQPGPNDILQDSTGTYIESAPYPEVDYERVEFDYLPPEDFLYNKSRHWEEVRWVARKLYFTSDELRDEFDLSEDDLKNIRYEVKETDKPDGGDDEKYEIFRKACVYEIWHKEDGKVYWFNKGLKTKFLDEKDDFLRLKGFFPCPKPLVANPRSDAFLPVPEYLKTKDTTESIREISLRKRHITEGIKATGVFNAQVPGLDKLVEGDDNVLYPVENWAIYQQAGGAKGNVEYANILERAQVVQILSQELAAEKQNYYEQTGMSDIVRGASNPNETATAQSLKGNYANLRIQERQQEMQRFVRDAIAITAEIIAEHFQPRTLEKIAGVDIIDDTKTKINFDDAVELLKHDTLRCYRISIETDSTIAVDEAKEKQAVTELFASLGQFAAQMAGAAQALPEIKPVLPEFFLFAARRFRAGRNLESAIENAQQQAASAPQQPDPEAIKAQQAAEEAQAKMQLEQQKLQIEQAKEQGKQMLDEREISLKEKEMQIDKELEEKKLFFQAYGRLPGQLPDMADITMFDDPVSGNRRGRMVIPSTGEAAEVEIVRNPDGSKSARIVKARQVEEQEIQ